MISVQQETEIYISQLGYTADFLAEYPEAMDELDLYTKRDLQAAYLEGVRYVGNSSILQFHHLRNFLRWLKKRTRNYSTDSDINN